ncbi:hypothetical protein ACFP3I_11195 [Chryseobacterium arachidis]
MRLYLRLLRILITYFFEINSVTYCWLGGIPKFICPSNGICTNN